MDDSSDWSQSVTCPRSGSPGEQKRVRVAGAHIARILIGLLAVVLNVKRSTEVMLLQTLQDELQHRGFHIEEIASVGGTQTVVVARCKK